jgi:hypothetical protein
LLATPPTATGHRLPDRDPGRRANASHTQTKPRTVSMQRARRGHDLYATADRSSLPRWRRARCGSALASPSQSEPCLCQGVCRGRCLRALGGARDMAGLVGVAFVSGSGVTSPKCRCSGICRPRWIQSRP